MATPVGARFRRTGSDSSTSAASLPVDQFDIERRGYDRLQVDNEITRLRAQLDAERRRADSAESQAKDARARSQNGDESGFGQRVEAMLRLAEREAAEIKANAASEAAKARIAAAEDAAKVINDAHQQAAVRTAEVEQGLAKRRSEISAAAEELHKAEAAHKAAVERELAGVRKRSEEIRATAEREAASVVDGAAARARETTTAAETAASKERERARADVDRLIELRTSVLSKLGVLHARLTETLGTSTMQGRAKPGERPDAKILPVRRGAARAG